MKNKFQNFAIAITAVVLVSCSSNDEDLNLSCAEKITEYADKITAAGIVYTNDPTSENCMAYKTAIRVYIENTEGCVGSQPETFKALLDQLDCQ